MSRQLISENLKNWYVIDSILLNGHAKNMFIEGKAYKEYISLKSAMLSNLYEFYQHIEYDTVKQYKNSTVLQEAAVASAKVGKSTAAKMLQKPEFKKLIKNIVVKESERREIKDLQLLSNNVINERFLRMSLDNALLGIPLLESNNPSKLKDFKGEILEESYRLMRTALIKLVKTSKLKK